MPCDNVSERISVTVDSDDCLQAYCFTKQTCGQGVGVDDLLSGYLDGKPVERILQITPDTCIEETNVPEGIEEFLTLKHLVAVQAALEALTGQDREEDDGFCTPLECAYEDGLTTLQAFIRVDLVTDRIKSCGGCKGCGSKRRKRKSVAATG